jgi:uncharacterized protein (TIGR02996 family)
MNTMTHEDAFLQDILSHPDDDTTRLIYADWLEDHNDPRGRLLRLQVELARMAREDPRRPAADAEFQALVAGTDRDWLALAGKHCDLILHAYLPGMKIWVIKVIRELTGMGLIDAKDLSESPLPVVMASGLTWPDAESAREALQKGRGSHLVDVEVCISPSPYRRPGMIFPEPGAYYDLVLHSFPRERRDEIVNLFGYVEEGEQRETFWNLCIGAPVTISTNLTRSLAEGWGAYLRPLGDLVAFPLSVVNQAEGCDAAAYHSYDLHLQAFRPENKLAVIRLLQEVLGCDLSRARNLAEGTPTLIQAGLTREEAERGRARLGSQAEVLVCRPPWVGGP